MKLPEVIVGNKETILSVKYGAVLLNSLKKVLEATPGLNQAIFEALGKPHSFSNYCWDLHEFEAFCYILEHNLTEKDLETLPTLKDKVKALELLKRITSS